MGIIIKDVDLCHCYDGYNDISDFPECISIVFTDSIDGRIGGTLDYDPKKDKIVNLFLVNGEEEESRYFGEIEITLRDIDKIVKVFKENNNEWPYDRPVVF